MAVILLIMTLLIFAALGYWRGGMRVGLAVLPLLIASILLWLLLLPVLEITTYFHLGLAWPPLVIGLVGLAAGYITRFLLKRRLGDEIALGDRISGMALGLVIGLVVFELGLLYTTARALSNQPTGVSDSRLALAERLNNGFVRFIPGVGAGSDALTNLTRIASAPEDVRHQALDDLGLSHLIELDAVQTLVNDPATYADIEDASRGSLGALWRLQKNELVLALADDDEFMEAVSRLSLGEIAAAVDGAQHEVDSSDP
ncbi:MAG: hypothetical protein ACF8PN_11045 [Phycisphaerales bacterium]